MINPSIMRALQNYKSDDKESKLLRELSSSFISDTFRLRCILYDDRSTVYDVACEQYYVAIKFQDTEKDKAKSLMDTHFLFYNRELSHTGLDILEKLQKMTRDKNVKLRTRKIKDNYIIVIAPKESETRATYSRQHENLDKRKASVQKELEPLSPIIRDEFFLTEIIHDNNGSVYKLQNPNVKLAITGSLLGISKGNIVLIKFQDTTEEYSKRIFLEHGFFNSTDTGCSTSCAAVKDAAFRLAMTGKGLKVEKITNNALGIYSIVFTEDSRIPADTMLDFMHNKMHNIIKAASVFGSFGGAARTKMLQHHSDYSDPTN